jgi:tetratricopeptide (TPR) repeat protein
MLGRSEQAALAYRRALELDPLNEQLYESLFRVYRASGREDELLGLLEELSLRDRRNPVLLGRLAELADRRGLYEQAGAYRRRRAELEVGDSYDD